MASSNVIATVDQTGKHKWQNLDSAFGGQYEDLLTLGKGQVKVGVVVEQPYIELKPAAAATSIKASGPAQVVFITGANSGTCDIKLAELVAPVGSMITFVVIDDGAGLTLTGKGLSGATLAKTTSYLVKPDGTLALAYVAA
jgi:hypothetical protein